MRALLDELDPLFAAAAVAIAGLTLSAHLPHSPVLTDHPPLDIALPDAP